MNSIASQPVALLKGVGEAAVKRLSYLHLHTIGDLVHFYPRDHEDLSHVIDVIDIVPGEKATIKVKIEAINARRAWKRKINLTEARVGDETGSLRVVWFNQPYLAKSLEVGDELYLSSVVKRNKMGLVMQSPVHEKVTSHAPTHTARIVPTYPLTAGITQKQMRFFIKQALERVLPLEDFLPEKIVKTYKLLSLTDAIQQIHFPTSKILYDAAKQRLEFNEAYLHQCMGQLLRKELHERPAPPLKFHEKEIKAFVAGLPYRLTNAQRTCAWTILKDLTLAHPMNRLLVGDVGSGKTVVAAIALLNTVLNGYQAAVMVPTEILAKQHYASLTQLFKKYKLRIELLTSETSKEHKKWAKKTSTQAQVIVGTHALIQSSVSFSQLGLVIIDEQHRFGVRQRKTLKEQTEHSDMPHLLSMTATPIPRTLALTLFSDLDLCVIDEMPPGRKPVKTHLVPPQKRMDAYQFIRDHIKKGEQAFVVCPLIEASEKLVLKSVTDEFERLSTEIFPDLNVGLLHGRMKADEKERVMNQMRRGLIDVLVCTSVIEVGVDIPNATLMVIEGAERFGLAQLHQFRGRVGRSDLQSFCLLFTSSNSSTSRDRLNAFTHKNNGFELAEIDLETRGAGHVFGTEQSGFFNQSFLNFTNSKLINDAQEAAQTTLTHRWHETFTPLKQKIQQFIAAVHLE